MDLRCGAPAALPSCSAGIAACGGGVTAVAVSVTDAESDVGDYRIGKLS